MKTNVSANKPSLSLDLCLNNDRTNLPQAAREVFRSAGIRGLTLDDDFYLTEGTSLFHLRPASRKGRAHLAPAFFDQPPLLQCNFWGFGLIKLLRPLGLFLLHSAALVTPEDEGLLLAGESGSGKSTLTMGLIRQGWHYLTDDAVLLRRLEASRRRVAAESPLFYLLEMGGCAEKARFLARVIAEAAKPGGRPVPVPTSPEPNPAPGKEEAALPARPRRRAHLVVRKLDREFAVHDPEADRTVLLNATAATVLDLCDGHRTAGEIAGELAVAFSVGNRDLLDDVKITLRELVTQDLVERGQGQASGIGAPFLFGFKSAPGVGTFGWIRSVRISIKNVLAQRKRLKYNHSMIDEHKVGQRLRALRKAAGRTQGKVAADLGVSRATVAQIELGNRAIKVSEVERVAEAYRADVGQLIAPSPSPQGGDDVLDGLIRTVPALEAMREDLGRFVTRCRALTEIEGILAVHAYSARPPIQALPAPETPWEAVHQGYATAAEERRRLNLGDGPIRDVDETLAVVGVRPTKLELPNDISSLMISSPETGFLVVANKELPVEERRFQYIHAYAHILFDRDAGSCACQRRDAETLSELRASAFASRYLVPKQGLKRYLQSLGKDTLARSEGTRLQIYSERKAASLAERRVSVSGRDRRGAAPCGTVEVTLTAGYFGASPLLICHALCDLGFISRSDLDDLASRVVEGDTKQTQEALNLPAWGPERNAFRTRLLVFANDALAQGLISRERFERILEQAELPLADRQPLIDPRAAATGTRRHRVHRDNKRYRKEIQKR